MNIDDLRADIEDMHNGHYDDLADALEILAYAWENQEEKDLNNAVYLFLLDFVDYPIPNFIDSDIDWKKVEIFMRKGTRK